MNRNKYLYLLLLFLTACPPVENTLKAQSDFDLTQRRFNETLYNPAAAGNNFTTGLYLHGRHQWVGIHRAPSTYAVTFDTYVENINSGIGITYAADNIGVTNSHSIRVPYAYYLKIGRSSALSFGLSAGLLVYSKRAGEALIDDPADPELAYGNATEYSPDFDFGLEYKGPFKSGITVRHIGTKYTNNFPKHTVNIWAYLSSRFNATGTLSFEPSISAAYRANVIRWEAGLLLYFFKTRSRDTYNDRFWLGAALRRDNGIALIAGLNITPRLSLGYSFDYGTGQAATLAKYGTHEIFVAFRFNRIFYKDEFCPAYRNSGISKRKI